ncbi:hypothetical protein [Alloscardovia macacae]|uniref:Uncharacterized protein n=1 Tax=Alloscardovia macacae TaxID=1160091 RepID=A0A261F5G1_9BIFI|nr:hypothetical protein [Alloscardovia macacae]OZG54136.1 hypothetical protein ALMA_0597 [Alloscardovia macacae]
MINYLSLSDIAERIGVKSTSMSLYKLPEPDARIGRTRGWLPETIDAWQATRPGHGGRPRKSDDK